jgi:hypothetical protein
MKRRSDAPRSGRSAEKYFYEKALREGFFAPWFRFFSLIPGFLAYSRLAVGGGAKRNDRLGASRGGLVGSLQLGLARIGSH